MVHRLANETLHQVFSYHFHVDEDDFTSVAGHSPFAQHRMSRSVVLLVCKRWLRVATPPLYRVVILRSTAQARSLSTTLRLHDGLGEHVRKLRVEGGYGAAMERILLATPNIADLALVGQVYSTDNTKSLCKMLPTLDVRSFTLIGFAGDGRCKAARELYNTICICVKSRWKNLVGGSFSMYSLR